MTARARFTQADLTRAVKAMRKAGCAVTGAEIMPSGSIRILTDVAPANDVNPLERMLHG